MSELPKPENDANPLAKLESLREQVAEVDKFLKDEDLSTEDVADLLDEREGLRLQALADVMTRMKLTSFPDIDSKFNEYFRPSKRQELNSRLESVDDKDLEQLKAIELVIVRDAGAQKMDVVFSNAKGQGNINWVDQATEIKPVIDKIQKNQDNI
jgi:DNA-binding transcriptional MerR regulator